MPNSTAHNTHASVSASLTQAVLSAASDLGLSRQELIEQCELHRFALHDPDARVSFAHHERLWLALSEQLPQPEPGLLIGQHLGSGPFSVLSYLLQCSATLGDALDTALRYQRLAGEGGELSCERDGPILWLVYTPLHPRHPATRTRVLAMLACWLATTAPLVDGFTLQAAQFSHAAPAQQALYEQVFACTLHFGATRYALGISHDLCQRPLRQANPALQPLLRQHAQTLLERLPNANLKDQAMRLIAEQLAHGEPDRAALATALNLSERTLQRRLAEEQVSYQQLLADTRRQLAEQHLREGHLPATEIALLLGYSEPSVFFRAFRQWTGLTPGEYRQRTMT